MRNSPPQSGLSKGGNGFTDASITLPEGNKYHLIKHEQFEEIMKIEQPKSLLTATGCLMYALGDFRNQLSVINKPNINGKIEFLPWDLFFLALFIGAIVGLIFFGISAFRSESKREKILKEMAARSPQSFDPEKLKKAVI